MNQDWPDYPNKNAQVLNTSDLKKNEAFVLVSNTYHCCMRGHPSPLSQDSSSAIHPTWVDQMQEVYISALRLLHNSPTIIGLKCCMFPAPH
eukprot:scaffold113448_cov17-Tisochrysis_lutea.AAC.4